MLATLATIAAAIAGWVARAARQAHVERRAQKSSLRVQEEAMREWSTAIRAGDVAACLAARRRCIEARDDTHELVYLLDQAMRELQGHAPQIRVVRPGAA